MINNKNTIRLVLICSFLILGSCSSPSNKKTSKNVRSQNQVQVRPGSAEMLNLELGVGYLKRGQENDIDYALEKFKRAVLINPKFALAHSMLANTYDRKGFFDDAEKHYKLSMKHNNNSPDIINNYANFLCQRKKFDQAVALYLGIIKDPEYTTPATAYENAGICLSNTDEPAKAEGYFRKALEYNPKMPNSLFNLMNLYYKKQDFMKARAFLQRLEQVAPKNAEVLAAGYQIEKSLKNNDLADNYYTRLKQSFPDSDVYKKLK